MEPVTEYDIDILARTLVGEAITEGERGMEAVACVVKNRAKYSGKSLAYECKKPWQFSCWNAPDLKRNKIDVLSYDNENLVKARNVARKVMSSSDDITIGATHYFADYIKPPYWADPSRFTVQIGVHRFFDLHGEFEKGKLLQLLSRLSILLKSLRR